MVRYVSRKGSQQDQRVRRSNSKPSDPTGPNGGNFYGNNEPGLNRTGMTDFFISYARHSGAGRMGPQMEGRGRTEVQEPARHPCFRILGSRRWPSSLLSARIKDVMLD